MTPTRRTYRALLTTTLVLGCLLGASLHCARSSEPLSPVVSVATVSTRPRVGPPRLYGQAVVLGANAKPVLKEAAAALAKYLTQATGAPFDVASGRQQGIFLLRTDAPDAPADVVTQLRGLGREPYFLRSVGDGKLLIVANEDAGLVLGMYQVLEDLGYRFYFPNDRWTIVPELRDIERPFDKLVRPAFRMRAFSGTGGLGKNLAVDARGELKARWETWKVANGFGQEFNISGHAGEAFNVRHKEALLANPNYLASVDGKRVGWSKIAKLDPTNSDVVGLFVRDRVEAYRTQRQRDPGGPNSFAVSVEPADGGGECNSPACAGIGGPSEQHFFLANAVARALAHEFPGAQASLFAYNFHAEIPEIAIEPNVYVTLVPYAFRRTGSDPETFIKEWAKARHPLSIYDYWSIPDWAADLPTFDYRNTPTKKLRFWHEQGIEGFLSESTYSAGAMGLAWYIAGKLMWAPDRDAAPLANEFFRDSFESAAPPMRRMLERWAAGFLLTQAELHASFADLADAFARSPSPSVSARLVDYAGYLQYLRLRYELDGASDESKRERKRAVIVHLWRIYDTAMVDTFRLQQLLLRGDEVLAAELNPNDASLPIWKALTPLGEAEARQLVQAGVRELPAVDMALKAYAGELVRASGAADDNSRPAGATTLTLVGPCRLELTVAAGISKLQIQVSSKSAVQARLIDAHQQDVANVQFKPSPTPMTFSADVPAPGVYWFDFRVPKNAKTTLQIPTEVGVELQDFRIPKGVTIPDLYFFVPPGEKRIAFHSLVKLLPPEKGGPLLFDASNVEVTSTIADAGHVLSAAVAPGQDGKVWTLRRAVAPDATLRLLNAPQRFALSRTALRVPAGALTVPRAAASPP